jgi:hypothetical protein
MYKIVFYKPSRKKWGRWLKNKINKNLCMKFLALKSLVSKSYKLGSHRIYFSLRKCPWKFFFWGRWCSVQDTLSATSFPGNHKYITAVQSTAMPNWIWRSVLFNDLVCCRHYVSSVVDEENMFVDDSGKSVPWETHWYIRTDGQVNGQTDIRS